MAGIQPMERAAQLYNTREDSWTSLPYLGQRGYPWSVAWVLNGHTIYVTGSRDSTRALVMFLSLARFLETGPHGLEEWGQLPLMDRNILDTVEILRL